MPRPDDEWKGDAFLKQFADILKLFNATKKVISLKNKKNNRVQVPYLKIKNLMLIPCMNYQQD